LSNEDDECTFLVFIFATSFKTKQHFATREFDTTEVDEAMSMGPAQVYGFIF
jgi:hypothetical protein